jgi:hypothetical protein
MKDLFTKLNYYIDYNNQFSIKKALSTLEKEFNIACKTNNVQYANSVIHATKQLHDTLHSKFLETAEKQETMSYAQKVMSRKIEAFIFYCAGKIKSDFGVSNDQTTIEQAIS